MTEAIKWLASTIGRRGYIARYLRASSPAGSTVVGTGNDPYTPGFLSCDRSYLVPSVDKQTYLDEVLRICREEHITAAISLSDVDVPVLAKARRQMTASGIACFFPGASAAHRYTNKYEAAHYWNEHGVATPRTFSDLRVALDVVGLPVVIKPRRGSGSAGLAVCADRTAAMQHWRTLRDPIAQELVRGRLVNVEACSDHFGRVLAVSAWERHRSVAGETLLAETIDHHEAIALALRILELSPIPGPVDFDMIETNAGMSVIECNTRFGGGYPVSHLAGADFTGALVRAFQGREPGPLAGYRTGVVMMKDLEPAAYDISRVVRR